MDYRFLEHRYHEMRERQMCLYGRQYTPIDMKVSKITFDTALRAIDNVSSARSGFCMEAVPLSTGLGKSTSTYALIATLAEYDKNFSAAYVAPTIKLAMEAQEGIEALLGKETTILWSSHHKHEGVDRKQAMEDLGFIPTRTANKADLPSSRIVIITHQQLKREMQTGYVEGCTSYLGHPRSIVFIDEHPDLVQVFRSTGAQLQSFHDDLLKLNPEHPWLPLLSLVTYRMNQMSQTSGQTYSTANLLSREEGKIFNDDEGLNSWKMTDSEVAFNKRNSQHQIIKDTISFLKIASQGKAFYSRKDHAFFAFRLDLADYPGFVLLDATSDITGLVDLHPGVHIADVPRVNHENLDLYHLEQPRKFRRKSDFLNDPVTGREYGHFIMESVLANTSEGDHVLIIVYKDVLTHGLIETSDDPSKPLMWQGRKVNTLNWGDGVGLNKFKHKTHVFHFGDYYMKNAITIARTHAWSQNPLTDKSLLGATSIRKAGSLYVPKGDYGKTQEGHILSWTKQLAMRGTARQVDADGKCHPMKLFTTMDLDRLLPSLNRLFPGAPAPALAKLPDGTDYLPMTGGREGLKRLLVTSDRPWLSAKEIEKVTGIKTNKLATEFEAIAETIETLGWRLIKAKEMNISGREKYLVHDARFTNALLKAA